MKRNRPGDRELFASNGARVAITGLDEAWLVAAGAQVGAGTITIRADLRSLADLVALRDTIARDFGWLDILSPIPPSSNRDDRRCALRRVDGR
jgi:hypothetical protein